jgi:hypothetical protein
MTTNTNTENAAKNTEDTVKAATLTKAYKDAAARAYKSLGESNVKLVGFLDKDDAEAFIAVCMYYEDMKNKLKSVAKLVTETVRPMIAAQCAKVPVMPYFGVEGIPEARREAIKEVYGHFLELLMMACPGRDKKTMQNLLSGEFVAAGFAQRAAKPKKQEAPKADATVAENAGKKNVADKDATEPAKDDKPSVKPGLTTEELTAALVAMGYQYIDIQRAASLAQKLAAKALAVA